MIDWNYVLSQIATVAFDILYFGAIIGTIVIIILDNRNPVKRWHGYSYYFSYLLSGLSFIFSLAGASVVSVSSGKKAMTAY